jgi:hypothetical protein
LQDILDGKVSQEEGKGLSTNDYSDEDKAQVALISGLQASIGNLDTLLNGSKEGDETIVVGLTETVRNLQTVVGNIDLSKYVLQTDFNTAVGEINDAIADIEQDITDLDQRMQWGTIEG